MIFLVNVPSWFSFIWRIVKPMVHEVHPRLFASPDRLTEPQNTQKKVKILSKREVLAGLSEHIDVNQIPVYYGGKLDMGGHDSCR
jgi:hypothetical protein